MSLFDHIFNKPKEDTAKNDVDKLLEEGSKQPDVEIRSFEDAVKNKKKKVLGGFAKIGLILLLIFFVRVIWMTMADYKASVKKEQEPPKRLIPEMNLTADAQSRWQLTQEAKNEFLLQQIVEIKKRQEDESNRTIAAMQKLLDDKLKKSESSARERTQQGYPLVDAPKRKPEKNTKQQLGLPPSVPPKIVQKMVDSPSDIGSSDFLPSTDSTQPKRLGQNQINQAQSAPLVVQPSMQQPIYAPTMKPKRGLYAIDVENASFKTSSMKLEKNSTDNSQIPNFSMIKGYAKATLLGGFKAPTLAIGKDNPQPVFLSLDSQILGANNQKANVQDCMLQASAIGNINTGRAEIRLSEIECVVAGQKNTYKVAEKVEGWIYGEDGEFGLQGRLIDVAGKAIDPALPLMAIEAIVGAVKGSTTSTVIPGLGAVSGSTNIMSNVKQGAVTGFEKSTDKVVDYYLKVLDAMQPSIEVKAARKVIVSFKGGEKLKVIKYEPIDVGRSDY